MKILFIAAEMSPLAKVGGLADVIGSLPRALRSLGLDARIVMPHYRMVDDNATSPVKPVIESFEVKLNNWWIKTASLHETEVHGVPVWLIGTDEWFGKSVSSETLYQPGGDQHLFLCSAALEAMEQLEWIPDVVHCHDWHTGLLPVLMREKRAAFWSNSATVFTIHNFAYQGQFGVEVLDKLELSRELFNPHQLETWGRVNFLKSGCVYADRVNTVSKTYAQEIQTPEFGCSLDGLMRHLASEGCLSGILNGIDTEVFDPSTDPDLPDHFSAADPTGKAACKRLLRKELKLSQTKGPLAAVVSRLSSQKGLDLLFEAGPTLERLKVQLVVQGLGEPPIVARLRSLAAEFPKNVRLVEEFDPAFAQRLYAGADLFVMPSRFEPCGLGQMIAMRYGTVPLVRATGGLKDTVTDGQTGFVFQRPTPAELFETLERAVGTYHDESAWRALMVRAMTKDFSWDRSAKEYAALYQACVADRLATSA